ncbi:hypothetical protein SDC9_21180 [bioreactor metagenome]|uniref:Peptidase U32 collagenase domain-containing protein n=1 Tax=bioreactor metagenome TaxID=1076179 RepID=A0A644U8S9_9ZZZZ|nr:U32 family peptidase [Methanobrevibacter sp.]MEA4958068.1 U32 family peptidase [Methanobrevibacter sp.]
MKLPELLAPVGSVDHLKLAIFSGASSIYLSGKKFGARKYAENFSLSEMKFAVKFAHIYNVKVFVTVNTLIKDNEIIEVMDYIFNLYKMGIDGILIQDVGLLNIVNHVFPDFSLHASTQMNIQNIDEIKWAKNNGISRIVLPRELNLNETKEMVEFAHSIGIEVEIFVHGALCYSYSGRCLFSSLIGNRSGNRGDCAQPCRQKYQIAYGDNGDNKRIIQNNTISNSKNINNPISNNNINSDNKNNKNNHKKRFNDNYDEEYLISTKDLSLFNHLPELIELGVDSLKIEGRMRNKEYVSTVVKQYSIFLNQLKGSIYSKDKNKFNKYNNISNYKNNYNNISKKNFSKNNTSRKNISRKNSKNDKKSNRINVNLSYGNYFNNEKYFDSKEKLNLVFNRNLTNGHLLSRDFQNIMSRSHPGHRGLFIGTINDFDTKTNEMSILLKKNLINIPQRADGLLIESFNGKYGFEISNNPILDNDTKTNEKNLLVKIVKENNNIGMPIKKGDSVYLTKRKKLNDLTKSILNDKNQKSIKKTTISIKFLIDSSNSDNSSYFPVLEANVKLDNGKNIKVVEKSNDSWEIAQNKPITTGKLKKQLSKIGDLPFYISNFEIIYSENLFAPLSKINEFRRNFFNKLEKSILDSYKPDINDIESSKIRLNNFKRDFSNKFNNNINNNINNININSNNNNSYSSDISSNNYDLGGYSLSIYLNNLENLRNISNINNNHQNNNYQNNHHQNNNNNNNNHDNHYRGSCFDRVYFEVPVKSNFSGIKPIDISYYVMFLKEAFNISKNQNYELVWKWPDIVHSNTREGLIKILGILKKLNIKINVMTSLLGINNYLKNNYNINVYGSYPLNIFNSVTASNFKDFDLLTISPELSMEDLEFFMNKYNYKDPVLEVIIKGKIEALVTRKPVITKKHYNYIKNIKINANVKKTENNSIEDNLENIDLYLNDYKDNFYPLKNVEDGYLILDSKDVSLENKIPNFLSMGIKTFSIDARWKNEDYLLNLKL